VGQCRAEHYYRDWFRPGWAAIRQGLRELQADQPGGRLVLEGAGSPVEVNLQSRDLTNLRLAQFLRAHCLLVADIERGGVFAQLVGTLQLLRPVERPLIRGLLINRFRGRRELFDEGRRWLESHTGIPVLGVMPWLDELFPPEDSLDLLERRGRKRGAELEIAVLRLPSLSNFSDLDPLEAEPTVQLNWVAPGEALGQPDAVVVPGSKQTLRDLAALRRSGLAEGLLAYVQAGGQVFGICGGMQMLGSQLQDPEGLEGGEQGQGPCSAAGLGLLPLHTQFGGTKALRQRRSQALWPAGPTALDLEGFELHRGLSTSISPNATASAGTLAADDDLGWWQSQGDQGGLVAGTYLHGVFESGPWRRRWLNQLRQRKGLAPLSEQQPHHSRQREALLDRLADAFEAHVDLTPLLQP
jgi:adenosylcobyric acid synthase